MKQSMQRKGAVGGNLHDEGYIGYLNDVQARVNTLQTVGPIFHTDVEEDALWETYLSQFPYNRQYHNCSTCRAFVKQFGGLVAIDKAGRTVPLLWEPTDAAMGRLVSRAKPIRAFVPQQTLLGTPVTGVWRHYSVTVNAVGKKATQTAGQREAELLEDFKNVQRALSEFPRAVCETAVKLLEAGGAEYRAEKVLGPARWLRDLHIAREGTVREARRNVVWRAVALAPAGFAHPRSSMIGTLLEDLRAGKSYEEVGRAFRAKMNPLAYQRPQAAPRAGNIERAEKIFAELGLAPALRRRMARIEEIPLLWAPADVPQRVEGGGIFAHLKPKEAKSDGSAVLSQLPAVTMTLEKFAREVLLAGWAEKMEIHLGTKYAYPIAFLTTAVDPEAPPLLQWDRPEARNPFAWYCWTFGTPLPQIGLAGGWLPVAGITRLPSTWNGSKAIHQGDGLVLLLEGARETKRGAGAAIFPETLRSELHEIRSTIEAYSRAGEMEGLAEGSAIGYDLRKGAGRGWPIHLRLSGPDGVRGYKLDRWE